MSNPIELGRVCLVIAGAFLLISCSVRPDENTSRPDAGTVMNHQGMKHDMSMDLGPADKEYDLRFIDAMILHHKGAVKMADEALNKTRRSEIKKLAIEIIAAQEKEIKEMETWRKNWYPEAGDSPIVWYGSMNHSMPMNKEQMETMMMNMNLGKDDEGFDRRFIDAMIPHHEGALTMAKDALAKSTRPEIKQLSDNILKTQREEIDRMEGWRKNWYGK